MGLTDAGKERFAEVLDYDIDVDLHPCASAVVHVDGDGWKKRLHKAEEFFYALAGYCDAEDYDKWFAEPAWGQYGTDPDANISVCVYCDSTPWYTEDEIMHDNLVDLVFPRALVQEYYESRKADFDDETAHEFHISVDEANFETWLRYVYVANDTDGLFNFCKERGFTAVREDF